MINRWASAPTTFPPSALRCVSWGGAIRKDVFGTMYAARRRCNFKRVTRGNYCDE